MLVLPRYEGKERNGETMSATLFHDSSGDVDCDWSYCQYVVVVISSDTPRGITGYFSVYLHLRWMDEKCRVQGPSGLRHGLRPPANLSTTWRESQTALPGSVQEIHFRFRIFLVDLTSVHFTLPVLPMGPWTKNVGVE